MTSINWRQDPLVHNPPPYRQLNNVHIIIRGKVGRPKLPVCLHSIISLVFWIARRARIGWERFKLPCLYPDAANWSSRLGLALSHRRLLLSHNCGHWLNRGLNLMIRGWTGKRYRMDPNAGVIFYGAIT